VDDGYVGGIAALGTAMCWVGSALAFTSAGRRIGSMNVNLIRLLIGLFYLMVVQWIRRGLPLPTDASSHAWLWLSVSGLVGFTFGDLCLFRAFVVIGPRLAMLIMSLAPPIAALTAWIALGERMSWADTAGMVLTLAGISWAILSRQPSHPEAQSPARTLRQTVWGVTLGFGGAVGQGVGLVLSKHGMGSYDALAATEIRLIAGAVGFALLFVGLRWWPKVAASVRNARGMRDTAIGAFFGPFLGVSLSLVAVQNESTGVAASIMATTPILIIPFSMRMYGEKVGFGGVAGAVLAVAGVALFF